MPDEKDPAEVKNLEALEMELAKVKAQVGEKEKPVPSDPWLQPKPTPALTRLLDHVDSLWSTFNLTFNRIFESKHDVDQIVFFYGRRSVDDFSEILLLCQNRYHKGATSLLRGMYERTVTAAYLSQHPDETSNFMDFYWVAQDHL